METQHLNKIEKASEPVRLNFRRNSAENADSRYSKENVLSRYRRQSIGSCHDFCKYGTKGAFDVNESSLNFRRNSTENADSRYSKEKVLSRYRRQSTGSCHDFCKFGTKGAFDVKESSINSKRVLRKSFDGQTIQQTGTDNSPVINFGISFASKSQSCKGLSANQRGISTRSANCQNQFKSAVHKTQRNITKPTSGASEGLRSKRETVKLQSTGRPVSTWGSLEKPEQQLRVPLSPRSPLLGVPSISAGDRTLICSSDIKTKQNLKQCASEEQNNDEVEEKTLYVVKIESGGKPPISTSAEYSSSFSESLSLREDQGESNFAIDGPGDITCLPNNATEDVYNRKTSIKHSMGELEKDSSNCCDEKDIQSLKLMFTSGKAVDLHSENNSPRKHRFRRGTIVGSNTSSKTDAGRRSSKRDSEVDSDAARTANFSDEVALKKQDVEDKEESEVLLNNVIEETGSELVELQNSRVKELVGVFETLMIEKNGSELVKLQNKRVKALVGVFETLISLRGNKTSNQHTHLRLRHGLLSLPGRMVGNKPEVAEF